MCLVVHSEQLLRDRNKLRKIIKPLVGRRLKVLDANCDMKKLYDRFTNLSMRVIKIVEGLCPETKELDNNIPDVKERFLKLRQLNNSLEVKENKKPSLKMRKALSRFGVCVYYYSKYFLIHNPANRSTASLLQSTQGNV